MYMYSYTYMYVGIACTCMYMHVHTYIYRSHLSCAQTAFETSDIIQTCTNSIASPQSIDSVEHMPRELCYVHVHSSLLSEWVFV